MPWNVKRSVVLFARVHAGVCLLCATLEGVLMAPSTERGLMALAKVHHSFL